MSIFSERTGLVHGIKGESLFHRPFADFFRENELPKLFRKVDGLNDHRLLAIVTALLIEERVDKLLYAFFPKYDKLLETTDFTFSMKLRLVEALNFIPPIIIQTAHCLRKIRNAFAHNLELTQFSDLEQKLKNLLKTLRDTVYAGRENTQQKRQAEQSLHKQFSGLSFYCIVSLDSYYPNIVALRHTISQDEFENQLERKIRDRSDEIIKTIQHMSPKSMVIEDNNLIINEVEGKSRVYKLKIDGNEQKK